MTETTEAVDSVVGDPADTADSDAHRTSGTVASDAHGTSGTGDDPVDHATDALDRTVDHTTEAVDDTVDRTTDAVDDVVDRLDWGQPGASEPDPAEEPPDSDEGTSATEGSATPSLPSPTAPEAAPRPGQLDQGTRDARDLDLGDSVDEEASPGPGGPGSLFDGDGIGERAAFPLTLIALLAAFLGVQAWVDRRDPKLVAAPVEAEPDLVFERP